jgi:hypothetical protein
MLHAECHTESPVNVTMSPAFQAGISRVPEYHKFLMQPNDQWYAIVASDGIWDP